MTAKKIKIKNFVEGYRPKKILIAGLVLGLVVSAIWFWGIGPRGGYVWQSVEAGDLAGVENSPRFAGFEFLALKDGQATQLCGFFKGAASVNLYDQDFTMRASAAVFSQEQWNCAAIPAAEIKKGQTYYVAAEIANGLVYGRFAKGGLLPRQNDFARVESGIIQPLDQKFGAAIQKDDKRVFGLADIKIENKKYSLNNNNSRAALIAALPAQNSFPGRNVFEQRCEQGKCHSCTNGVCAWTDAPKSLTGGAWRKKCVDNRCLNCFNDRCYLTGGVIPRYDYLGSFSGFNFGGGGGAGPSIACCGGGGSSSGGWGGGWYGGYYLGGGGGGGGAPSPAAVTAATVGPLFTAFDPVMLTTGNSSNQQLLNALYAYQAPSSSWKETFASTAPNYLSPTKLTFAGDTAALMSTSVKTPVANYTPSERNLTFAGNINTTNDNTNVGTQYSNQQTTAGAIAVYAPPKLTFAGDINNLMSTSVKTPAANYTPSERNLTFAGDIKELTGKTGATAATVVSNSAATAPLTPRQQLEKIAAIYNPKAENMAKQTGKQSPALVTFKGDQVCFGSTCMPANSQTAVSSMQTLTGISLERQTMNLFAVGNQINSKDSPFSDLTTGWGQNMNDKIVAKITMTGPKADIGSSYKIPLLTWYDFNGDKQIQMSEVMSNGATRNYMEMSPLAPRVSEEVGILNTRDNGNGTITFEVAVRAATESFGLLNSDVAQYFTGGGNAIGQDSAPQMGANIGNYPLLGAITGDGRGGYILSAGSGELMPMDSSLNFLVSPQTTVISTLVSDWMPTNASSDWMPAKTIGMIASTIAANSNDGAGSNIYSGRVNYEATSVSAQTTAQKLIDSITSGFAQKDATGAFVENSGNPETSAFSRPSDLTTGWGQKMNAPAVGYVNIPLSELGVDPGQIGAGSTIKNVPLLTVGKDGLKSESPTTIYSVENSIYQPITSEQAAQIRSSGYISVPVRAEESAFGLLNSQTTARFTNNGTQAGGASESQVSVQPQSAGTIRSDGSGGYVLQINNGPQVRFDANFQIISSNEKQAGAAILSQSGSQGAVATQNTANQAIGAVGQQQISAGQQQWDSMGYGMTENMSDFLSANDPLAGQDTRDWEQMDPGQVYFINGGIDPASSPEITYSQEAVISGVAGLGMVDNQGDWYPEGIGTPGDGGAFNDVFKKVLGWLGNFNNMAWAQTEIQNTAAMALPPAVSNVKVEMKNDKIVVAAKIESAAAVAAAEARIRDKNNKFAAILVLKNQNGNEWAYDRQNFWAVKPGKYFADIFAKDAAGNFIEVAGAAEFEIKKTVPVSCQELEKSGDQKNKIDIVFLPCGYGNDKKAFEAAAKSQTDDFLKNSIVANDRDKFNFSTAWKTGLDCAANLEDNMISDAKKFKRLAGFCGADAAVVLKKNGSEDAQGISLVGAGIGFAFAGARSGALHEVGHALFNLNDEYSYGCTYADTANSANCDNSPNCDKWKDLPGAGCYAGCACEGNYRSAEASVMSDPLASGEFSPAAARQVSKILNLFQ